MLSLTNEYLFVPPALAAQWLDERKYAHQRGVRQRQIKLYANMMRRGVWRQDKEIKFASLNGNKYLVNGQHRLHAIVTSGVGQHFNVTTVTVSSMEEVADIYNTEDMGGPRSFMDIVRTMELPELTGIAQGDLRKLKGAVSYIDGDFGINRTTELDPWLIADMIVNDYSEAAGMFLESIADAPRYTANIRAKDRFTRSAVFAVGVVTYLEAADKYGFKTVDDFWSGAARDDGLRRSDPRKIMLNHIVATQMPSGNPSATGQDIVSAAYQSRYVASCFNSWVSGREYKSQPKIKRESERQPIKILGTKYDGQYLGRLVESESVAC